VLKDEYLEKVNAAGFGRIEVIQEKVFPISSMLNDPTAQAVIRDLELTQEDLKGLDDSVVSLEFTAIKG
jgi:hypothetical protein